MKRSIKVLALSLTLAASVAAGAALALPKQFAREEQAICGMAEEAAVLKQGSTGSLVSFETGEAVTYGLFNAQNRGTLIVTPGEKVYEGMVVGYTPTGEDISVNVCKTKHLSNTRASGSDDALRLVPVSKFSLEEALEFLAPDELVEVTPKNLRIRKRILNHAERMKTLKKK